jgi:hypothetical protein
MRRAFAIVCALIATPVYAEVGIGVSAKTDSATVYIPVTVQRFMFEPFVRATQRESESLSTSGTILPVTSASATKVDASAIGIGIFRLVPLADRFTLYYGGRLANIDEEVKSFNASGTVTAPPTLGEPSQVSTAEGSSVMPALGFHYNIVERLSIGAEIGIERSEADTENINRSQSGAITQSATGTITATDTRANVILRFFF